jgi:hypothetical protein
MIYCVFSGFINVYDKQDYGFRVYYNEFERNEIDLTLKNLFSFALDGNLDIIKFLNVDSIDYCTFGNSNLFE